MPMKPFSYALLLVLFALPAYAQDVASDDDYELIFADEFDLPNGSRPDPTRWQPCRREGATWSRWISDSLDVAYVQDGCLVCRAIPNLDKTSDPALMLTGAVETRDRFSFTYGKVLVRLRTNLHDGNFPAAWMMPQPPCDGWPRGGEIDIFESIDTKNTSYHTVHSHWTYDLGHRSEPQSSFSRSTSVTQWHVYGLEWTENSITWTVDGKEVGTYRRSASSSDLANGQWPFDHPFYLILNQSVGDGSWAKNVDTHYVYNTRFDYVRVYQRRQHDAVCDIAATRDTVIRKYLIDNRLVIDRNGLRYDISGLRVR